MRLSTYPIALIVGGNRNGRASVSVCAAKGMPRLVGPTSDKSLISKPIDTDLMQVTASGSGLSGAASGVGGWTLSPDLGGEVDPRLDLGSGPVNLAGQTSCGPCALGEIQNHGSYVTYRMFRQCTRCYWVYDGPLGFPRLVCKQSKLLCGTGIVSTGQNLWRGS